MVALIAGLLGIGGTLVVSYFVQLASRSWVQNDRHVDGLRNQAEREVEWVRGASTRELDQIHETLKEMQATELSIQKGLLRVELRLDSVEEYVDTQKVGAQIRGRQRTAP